MNPRHLTALILLGLLASGCASTATRQAAEKAPPEFAPSIGLCASPWGDMPTYRQPAPPQFGPTSRPGIFPDLEGTVVVDILVNRDGTVRDVAIVKSSGQADVDAAAVARARALRYVAKIHPDDPAPYVVPGFTVRFDGSIGQPQPVSYPYHTN